jgi:hypothetical protein
MSLSKLQHQVLIGTLLGDGHLEKNGHHVRLKIDHSLKQKMYVQWKYQVFKNLVIKSPHTIEVLDSRTNKVYKHSRFATKSLEVFDKYHQLFYAQGKKSLPKAIDKLLIDPLSLAVWYMDDGARRTDCRALRIHTNSFSLSEQKMLQSILLARFNFRTTIHRASSKSYTLYVPAQEAQNFCNLIEPHILPLFKGKLL